MRGVGGSLKLTYIYHDPFAELETRNGGEQPQAGYLIERTGETETDGRK